MKKLVITALLLFITMVLAACNQKEVSEMPAPDLILHLSKPEGTGYTVYKKIEDTETVRQVMDILADVSWENAKVSMSRQPDYKIRPINMDPAVSYEQVTYDIWLSPKKDQFEVVTEEQSKYGKLAKGDTNKLLSILEAH